MMNSRKLIAIALAGAWTGVASGITLGQIDTFQGVTTTLNWTGGGGPTNSANGGPLGTGDRFLRVTSSGSVGPGGHMATYNPVQWGGPWDAAGVMLLECDMNNLGATNLNMRLIMFSTNFTKYTSVTSVDLPAGSGWRHCYFPVRQSDLTLVQGAESYATLMSGIAQCMIRHNPVPDANGVPIVATLGIDNIRASAGWKMSGTVTLSDYVGWPPTTVTIEFRNPGTQDVVYTQVISLAWAGAYTVYSPPVPGAYDVSLKYDHWLRKTIPVASTNGDITLNITLLNGDVNEDNTVDIGDYSQLSLAYGSFNGDPNYSSNADLNGDDGVDIGDYSILSANYGLFGDD